MGLFEARLICAPLVPRELGSRWRSQHKKIVSLSLFRNLWLKSNKKVSYLNKEVVTCFRISRFLCSMYICGHEHSMSILHMAVSGYGTEDQCAYVSQTLQNYTLQFFELPMREVYFYLSHKLAERWFEGYPFNSNYTNVYWRAVHLFLYWSTYPWSVPFNAECKGRRHQVPFFSLWYDSTMDWSPK